MSRRFWVRVVPAVVSVALISTGMQVAAIASATPSAEPITAPAKSHDVTDRPDRVSAMVAAVAQGTRVEDVSQRTPSTATYANPNGTWTTESYVGVVRDETDASKWVPVDPTVQKENGGYAPVAAPVDAQYSDGGDKTVATATLPDDATVKVGWDSKLPAPTVAGDQLTYADAASSGSDLVVNSNPDGFDYSMVLDQAPAADAPQLEYRVPLSASGAAFSVADDGSILFKDGKNTVASMSPPVMYDSSTPDGGPVQHSVAATVEGDGSSRTLVLRPDMSYLRDPSTVYPVTVDPVFSIGAAGDTWVASVGQTTSQYSSPELDVGSINLGVTKARSYLSFDLSAMQAAGWTGTPLSATLSLDNFKTGACTGSPVTVRRVTGALSIPTVTWSTQPTTTDSNKVAISGSYGGGTGCPEGVATASIAGMVGEAMSAGSTLNVQLKADNESAAAGYRKYRSLENGITSENPMLSVTYDHNPNTPTGTLVSPGNPGYSTSLTPTLTTTVSDPDGGLVRPYFEVRAGTTLSGALAWNTPSGTPYVTSGSQASATVPSGALTDGTTYTVWAYSEDDLGLRSTTPDSSTFKVDVTAPTTSITSSAYVNNTWSPSVPPTTTFTFTGPSDTVNFDAVVNGQRNIVKATGGVLNFYLPPANSWVSMQATAIDAAGNRGPTATFNYGEGVPGFNAPVANARSTGSFPIDFSGPPGSTGATLGWRFPGETTYRTATHVTQNGATWTGTVTSAGGRSTPGSLIWNATAESYGTGTLSAPAVVQLQACFHYPAAPDQCSVLPRNVELVPSAFGRNFPTASVGPASVALFTGEASVNASDAVDSSAGLGRTFTSFSSATLNSGAFGPGWSDPTVLAARDAATSAQVIDNRSKSQSFVIVDAGSGSQTFVLASGSTTNYVPLQPTGDATKLTLVPGTGGSADTLTLARPMGSGTVTTTWTSGTDDSGNPAWVAPVVTAPGSTGNIAVTSDHQRPTWVRESDPSLSATCNATTQTVGCRGLQIAYSGTGSSLRVASVARVIGAATQSAVTVSPLATYTYSAGALTQVCSPSPDGTAAPLCTTYSYTTVAGRTLLAQEQSAGLKPWRFSYDSTGRLINVKRERPTGGDATWSVDYGLVISPSTPTPGMPDLTTATAAQWGQSTVPTKVFAVYQPYNGSADITKAELYYTTDDGTLTNTAKYGPSEWLVNTNWYDANGNIVQSLNESGYAAVVADPVISDRSRVAAEQSSYSIYNTGWTATGVDDNTRLIDEYGPAHTATLKNGTVGLYRTHTHTMFDDDPNVDSSLITTTHGPNGLGLAVEETNSVSDVNRTVDYDTVVTKFGYEPIVAGDGNGWSLGTPTSTTTLLSGGGSSTQITRIDSSGRQVESRQPGGSADGSGAGNDAHSTLTTYYTAGGSGDCGGKPAWDGLVCKVGPAAQPAGVTIPVTYTTGYNDENQPTSLEDISAAGCTAKASSTCSASAITASTSTVYDALGRPTSITKATTGSSVLNETIQTTLAYDPATGLETSTSSAGQSVTTGYDTWGRVTSYTDALGTSSSTSYDSAGNIGTFNDGAATYTYNYDGHNFLSSADMGGAVGTFTYSYNPNGSIASITYPNGVVATRAYDQMGDAIGLTYSQGSSNILAFWANLDALGRTIGQTSPASSQDFTYDDLGRLTVTHDNQAAGCTTRTYGFDASSNRNSFVPYGPGSGGACQTSTPITTSKTSIPFDDAGRNISTGYSYDTLGRTLTTPQTDTSAGAAGALTATYHANDSVASLSQSVTRVGGGSDADALTYSLDPAERTNTIIATTNGTESSRLHYRFADSSDSPAAVDSSSNGGASWTTTRNVSAPMLGMVATTTGGATTMQLANLHGDLVATMPDTAGAAVLSSYSETDEYGNSLNGGSSPRYGWLGSHERSTDALGGLIAMGKRVYNPTTGAFLQIDSVFNGSANRYGYPTDPINMTDLAGTRWVWELRWVKQWSGGAYGETDDFIVYSFNGRIKFRATQHISNQLGTFAYSGWYAGADFTLYCAEFPGRPCVKILNPTSEIGCTTDTANSCNCRTGILHISWELDPTEDYIGVHAIPSFTWSIFFWDWVRVWVKT